MIEVLPYPNTILQDLANQNGAYSFQRRFLSMSSPSESAQDWLQRLHLNEGPPLKRLHPNPEKHNIYDTKFRFTDQHMHLLKWKQSTIFTREPRGNTSWQDSNA